MARAITMKAKHFIIVPPFLEPRIEFIGADYRTGAMRCYRTMAIKARIALSRDPINNKNKTPPLSMRNGVFIFGS
jgi:hypothetical protein